MGLSHSHHCLPARSTCHRIRAHCTPQCSCCNRRSCRNSSWSSPCSHTKTRGPAAATRLRSSHPLAIPRRSSCLWQYHSHCCRRTKRHSTRRSWCQRGKSTPMGRKSGHARHQPLAQQRPCALERAPSQEPGAADFLAALSAQPTCATQARRRLSPCASAECIARVPGAGPWLSIVAHRSYADG